MAERTYPVIWVVGATRSCKTAIAKNGIAPTGFALVSTGDYFRAAIGAPYDMMITRLSRNIAGDVSGP